MTDTDLNLWSDSGGKDPFRRAFEAAPIGVGLAGLDGRFLRVNRALADLLGYQPEQMVGSVVAEITHPDDRPATKREIARLSSGEISSFHLEKRYVHRDGHAVWVLVSVSLVRDDGGEPAYMVGHVEDMTERKAIAERLEFAAIHDPLTELPNRLLLSDRLALALEHAHRTGNQVGVIFIDLDHFKRVNDSLGHAAGDELLKLLSDRLRGAVRPGDTVARIGGDEFVVVCNDVADVTPVVVVAQRVTDAIARPTMINRREVFITASVGVAISQSASDVPEDLLRHADAAMYRAKQARTRIEVFDERSRLDADDPLAIGAELHHALERSELEVHYQPFVDLETGVVSGFEALVRWRHPERGLLLPVDFLVLAEETGLIAPIGAWVLEVACQQLASWQAPRRDRPPLTMSVNLAPCQLNDPSFPGEVADILARTRVDPDVVWLELTEGALSHDFESSISALRTLRDHGVHLAVDDFGTGYSSLAYLKRFPVEMLKVDQSFIAGLGHEPDDTSIAGAVVNLAHSLGLTAVAEGLETPLQLRELRTMGCDYGQGHLFGAPKLPELVSDRPADDLSAWQAASPS